MLNPHCGRNRDPALFSFPPSPLDATKVGIFHRPLPCAGCGMQTRWSKPAEQQYNSVKRRWAQHVSLLNSLLGGGGGGLLSFDSRGAALPRPNGSCQGCCCLLSWESHTASVWDKESQLFCRGTSKYRAVGDTSQLLC